MLRPCVCLDLIFQDQDILAAIDTVAEAGVSAFEIWDWRDKDLSAIADRKQRYGMDVVNAHMYPIDLVDAEAVPEFLQHLRASIAAVKQLGCKFLTVHVQRVNWGPGSQWYDLLTGGEQIAERRSQQDNIVAALKKAIPVAQDAGIILMLEPLNTLVDHWGYFLSCFGHAAQVIQEVGSPNIKVLFDIYHMQISEGNLINNLTQNIDLLGHLHVADVPGRHEPGTGEIDFLNVLRAVKSAGYDGYVGLEYVPLQDTLTSIRNVADLIERANTV